MFTTHSFPMYSTFTPPLESTPLPEGLPEPVTEFFHVTTGNYVPKINTAVLSGRGALRFKGIMFNTRWRFTHMAGSGYHHYIETTLLGHPLMKVNEYYLEGHSRLELPFGIVENEPKVDMAANIGMWAESIWLPSILVTDPRIHWEAVDYHTASLSIPFQDQSDQFTATFDPKTHLLSKLESMRYREANSTEKIGWRNQVLDWQLFQGIRLPRRTTVQWLDEATPWFYLTLEEVVYNVDVNEYIHTQGI